MMLNIFCRSRRCPHGRPAPRFGRELMLDFVGTVVRVALMVYVIIAPVTKTIKVTLTTVPTKSSMSSLPNRGAGRPCGHRRDRQKMFNIIFCRAMLWVRRSAQETPAASDDRSGPIAPGRDRMPYSEEHKQETRQKILESARR